MSDPEEETLDTFRAGTRTETVTRTLRIRLETSQQKTDLVRTGIDEFQQMAAYMADMLPSFPEYAWTKQNTTMYRMVRREFPEATVKATIARDAAGQVAQAFNSWNQRGKPGDRPTFGEGSYMHLSHQDFDLVENERGYGIKASFIPYNPVWFHMNAGEFQEEYLAALFDEDDSTTTGSGELHLDDDGTLWFHLVVRWEVEVYEADEVSRRVGVDLGESVLYAVAIHSEGEGIEHVELESGDEFRHHRDRLSEKRRRASQQGDLNAVRACRGERERYTEQICHTASRRIVDLAAEHAPACIHLEDLTNYRETAQDPIHDWPYALLQEQIAYKARGAGIPVRMIDPRNTSVTCRHCGQSSPEYRQGDQFHCTRCNYQVHADVNAAINIARSGV